MRRVAALQAGFLLLATFAGATSRSAIRIKVLDSETRSIILAGSDVPKNCDQVNFDAYCNNSRTSLVTNTLLVQEGNHPPFRVACTVESKWSRCAPLPRGETLDARRDKRGITLYFVDDKGKARKQWYALLDLDKEKNAKDKDEDGDSAPPRTVAALATAPAARPALPPPTSSSPAPIPPAGSAQPVISRNVKCNFSSTPSGAEISIDGKYVGSTPSEISLSTGTHVVVFTNPGFNQWKRELTVLSDSELTVNAVLQKE